MNGHSRRDALKLLGAGAAMAAAAPAGAVVILEGAAPKAEYFPLAQVKLGEGPFLAAQKLDEMYLLELDADRMLANFRVNARLPPKAPVYGGWESVEPWIEIRCHGHTLGHYLSAAACMFASTGDARFAERIDYIVAELGACQERTGGWLTAFPDGVAPLDDSLAGKPFAGVPWYTTHKVMAGLRDAHVHRGSKSALEVLTKFGEWIDQTSAGVPYDRFQKMLDREHGGINEIFVDLYELTGQRRYLDLAQKFCHHALLEPLREKQDTLDGLHSNTQIPKVIGFSRLERHYGNVGYGSAARFFWSTVVRERSFATGGHGDVEHFFPRHEFVRHLGSAKTMETCCTHNMLRLTRSLYARDREAGYFDYFERALFNGILASQDPDTGMNTYFQATRPGYLRLYHTPFDSFWCCTGSGIENHARYGESIYAHDADTLYVNLFLASTLEWTERDFRLTQSTRFPDGDNSRLTLGPGKARKMSLAIRQPAWCPQISVTINGRKAGSRRGPGGYLRLTRTFRAGDVIDIHLPMKLHLEPLPDAPEHVAVMYGPIVLAARLGTQGITPGAQLIVNERKSGEMLNESIDIPSWSKPLDELPASLERSAMDSLTFTSSGFAGGRRVEFIPWYRISHERYNLYWRRRA